ncbi:phosphotransferase [Actinacidiphila bryophytorum]|uniref:Phosphotransferase enzyme family protein n=1 Tax=Actinacidiphila bryophytorum TaxID=1436133 RepID=A0A9W4H526_9ACTN|nr:phosphotransferase [Actinacidiphila bryophytorum]MBM9437250.1 phosphotransferase [Actinacidiphila bryophytorum]MBN6541770.1 phosphotransferase [Actinacidiphila bryophytorum]CAG7651262.1 Phosphotransferase enzyme family protein [Actinacidiphila bryophytorum]
MTTAHYVKHYLTAERCQTAVRNYMWLLQHAAPVRLPALQAIRPTSVTFEFVQGRHAQPSDLPRLATHLGDVHGASWVADLHRAQLGAVHVPNEGLEVPDYPSSRRKALAARHAAGFLPTTADLDASLALLAQTDSGPAAFYKDTNPRNVLITADAVVTIDVDDLTLAPFGYDLAKLIVTLTMTYGPLPANAVRDALDRYNQAAAHHHEPLGHTDMGQLTAFMSLHDILTAPYLGRNGYRYRAPGPSAYTGRGDATTDIA